MIVSYRVLVVEVVMIVLALGVSFGAGIAYGRGDPKTVQSGLTQQQIQSLLGISGAAAQGGAGAADPSGSAGGSSAGAQRQGQGGAGAQGGGGAQGGAGAQQGGGAAAAAAQAAAARNPSGRVTAVDGQTLTIETRTGSQKVNIGPSTTIQRLSIGSMSDFRVGSTILASGARKEDGSFDATE